MGRVEDIERYLKVSLASQRERRADYSVARAYPFITISRQTGVGGHALADKMLEVFSEQEDVEVFGGWRIYDRALCDIVAEDPGFGGSLESLTEGG